MTALHDSAGKPQSEIGPNSGAMMLARWLLVLAIVGGGYLAWGSLTSSPLAGCGTGSGCDKVLQSRWAYWLNLPVSVPAELVYMALLGATLLVRRPGSPDDERGTWAAIIALAVVVAGAALWFVGLQVFILRAFCKFCMAAHACGFIAALLCLRSVPLTRVPDTPMWSSGSGIRGVPLSGFVSVALMGLLGVVVLVGGQVLFPKQLNIVKAIPAGTARVQAKALTSAPTNSSAAPAAASAAAGEPVSPNAHSIAPGLLSLYDDRFRINLNTVPMIGSPGASNIIVYLFDYTCPHCRDLHDILVKGQRQLSNQLGVVCLPMPMSTNCNPVIPPQFHSSSNACEYARLGLAVWLADPKAQHRFDEWFFAPQTPASVEQAREYATQLVGAEKLAVALADPWIEQQILMDCQIHFANWHATGRPAMPQLIMGEAVSLGPLVNVQHLRVLLGKYLGLGVDLARMRPVPARP